MALTEFAPLYKEVESRVLLRTGKHIRNLEIRFAPEEVILLGQTSTFHVKQLAQHGVLDVLPTIRLYNRITVNDAI